MTAHSSERKDSNSKVPKPPGPKPDRVKVEGDWGDALKKALAKKKPPGGWPKQPR